jgi:hypothetical protein
MAHDWRAEQDGSGWRVVRLCDDGYRVVFAPSGDPELDVYHTEAAAMSMAATLNALDAEKVFHA